jgi:hypothetical protein
MTDTDAGLIVVVACSLVLLVIGVAHYRGQARWLAHWGILSEYTVLSLAWWGAGGLLSAGTVLLDGVGSTVADVGVVLLGVAGVAAGLVGLVGIVWLPRALRPRWLLDSQADPSLRDPGPGMRTSP